MSVTPQQILRDARKKHNLTQIQVAAMLCMSVEQVKRMEYGTITPEMSDVDVMEQSLPEPGLFRRWARAQYPEIVKYFGASDERDLGLMGAIVNAKHQMADVLNLQERVERDAVTGRFEDPTLRDRYRRELMEAQAAIAATIQKIGEVKT